MMVVDGEWGGLEQSAWIGLNGTVLRHSHRISWVPIIVWWMDWYIFNYLTVCWGTCFCVWSRSEFLASVKGVVHLVNEHVTLPLRLCILLMLYTIRI